MLWVLVNYFTVFSTNVSLALEIYTCDNKSQHFENIRFWNFNLTLFIWLPTHYHDEYLYQVYNILTYRLILLIKLKKNTTKILLVYYYTSNYMLFYIKSENKH